MLTDEQIFDILDGNATAEIWQQHKYLLTNSVDYKSNFEELSILHEALTELPVLQPSTQFTEHVLANISFAASKKKSWSGKLIYIFLGLMTTILFTAAIYTLFLIPTTNTTVEVPNQYFVMATNFLTDTFVKIAILANLIVLLVIFDKKILKPYFLKQKMRLS